MASLKPIFRNATEANKTKFKNSKCLLTISVGQETHEHEFFDTTIDLVNRSFDSCILLVDDSLQRHTMALNSIENADYYYTASVKAGNLWLERNKQYYSRLSIPTEILRWDTWLKHPNYRSQKKKLKALIESDRNYKAAFDISIEKFLEKYTERLTHYKNFNVEKAWQLSFDFLIEECTALCLWTELECQFEVYPSRRNQAMDETHKRFVLPNHPDLLHPIGIKFKNAKQIKPQFFEQIAFS